MTHKHKITFIKAVSVLTLILSASLLALIIFWLFYPYNPVEFKSKFVVTTPVVPQGGYMTYTFDICKNSPIQPEVIREYVNGIVFRSSNARANVESGCSTVTNTERIPKELPAGTYKFRVTVIYEMNPFREITYVNETNEFRVITGGLN